MKNTKLIRTLSSLEINEIQAFRDFVASPFFNKRPQSIRLLDILIPYTPAFPAEQIEKQTVFKQLFPGKPFALQKLKDESKLLFGLLRQFLAHSALNHHPTNRIYSPCRNCASARWKASSRPNGVHWNANWMQPTLKMKTISTIVFS